MTTQPAKNRSEATPRRALYAVVRYVPNVLRGEFVNVGVLVVIPGTTEFSLTQLSGYGKGSHAKRLPGSDGIFIGHAMTNLKDMLARQSREPWTEGRLAALCSMYAANNVQLSSLRSAAATDAAALGEALFARFVEDPAVKVEKVTRGKRVIREKVKKIFAAQHLFELGLEEDYLLPVKSRPVVDMAYKNGVWHCYQAIPFDLEERAVVDHVNAYRKVTDDAKVSGDPDLAQGVFVAFTNDQGNQMLRDDLTGVMREDGIQVVSVDDAPAIAVDIAADLRAHSKIGFLNA